MAPPHPPPSRASPIAAKRCQQPTLRPVLPRRSRGPWLPAHVRGRSRPSPPAPRARRGAPRCRGCTCRTAPRRRSPAQPGAGQAHPPNARRSTRSPRPAARQPGTGGWIPPARRARRGSSSRAAGRPRCAPRIARSRPATAATPPTRANGKHGTWASQASSAHRANPARVGPNMRQHEETSILSPGFTLSRRQPEGSVGTQAARTGISHPVRTLPLARRQTDARLGTAGTHITSQHGDGSCAASRRRQPAGEPRPRLVRRSPIVSPVTPQGHHAPLPVGRLPRATFFNR